MSTIFIAVECCQCSTMQVKQKKQSSKINKWTCVVCNQKQSIRQVFAQGPMAKDLRLFVQSSNMSRQFARQTQHHQQNQSTLVSSDSSQTSQRKRRTDWTQYLDNEDDVGANMKQEDEGGCGFESEIVTEFPAELFKKPKLHIDKPVFSQTNFNKHVVIADDEEEKKDELTITKQTSRSSQLMIRDDQVARSCQGTKETLRPSKWNDYITQEDDDDDILGRMKNRKRAENAGQWNNEMYKTLANYDYEVVTSDERVEDDIHPDFLQGSVVSNLGTSQPKI